MKKHLLPALVLLLLAPVSYGEGPANYVPESRSSSETFSSKVLKVYTFQDGDLDYAAYVVNWKDHEVIVTAHAFAGEKKYNVGDSIRCVMNQTQQRVGDTNRTRVSFFVASLGSEPIFEHARLDAIRAEVEARRAIRESALSGQTPKKP